MRPFRNPSGDGIHRAFADDFLELVRLLNHGAGLEHALMVTYLDAMFALKPEWSSVRGDIATRSYLEHVPGTRAGTAVLLQPETFLDVAIEEMQHLSLVCRLLVELGAAPVLTPHRWPLSSDIYPFPIHPRRLDRKAVATWLWLEADPCALSLGLVGDCGNRREPEDFIAEVRSVLGLHGVDHQPVNHLGSLYAHVLTLLRRVAEKPPAHLSPDFAWGEWELRLRWLAVQGEVSHYRFFRGLFTGTRFQSDASIWDPGPRFPAYSLPRCTAWPGQRTTIRKPLARQLAWLSDLHYWILLAVLDAAFRADALRSRYVAVDQMTQALWHLGLHLAAKHRTALPFDPIGDACLTGRDDRGSLGLALRLLDEAEVHALSLAADHALPVGYDLGMFALTRTTLQRAIGGGR